jgi:hypothetical protein
MSDVFEVARQIEKKAKAIYGRDYVINYNQVGSRKSAYIKAIPFRKGRSWVVRVSDHKPHHEQPNHFYLNYKTEVYRPVAIAYLGR